MNLILILLGVIAFIVLTTTKFKLHPFLALIIAAFLAAFAYGLPADSIAKTIASGFGGILGYIGLVIVLGTIIGVILEKSGAAVTMADTVIKVLGERFPTLTMSIIGYIVSVPVFCDSGFVILNSLKESLAKRLKTSSVAMSVALATGLYATHTFVPPTPGPSTWPDRTDCPGYPVHRSWVRGSCGCPAACRWQRPASGPAAWRGGCCS